MSYKDQDRGSEADYAAYFAGMNKSAQQKVALTTAHFPPAGTVADMGSGSGAATFDLAALYRGLELVGVDINDKSVAIAAKTYQAKNLRFVVGDIADPLFPEASLDGVLNSSVLHHVTSFNGFALTPVHRLLDNQVRELKPGGVLIIRDFVVPDGPALCDLELLEADTPALFVEFARTWKASTSPVAFEQRGPRTFRVSLRTAAEFVLRKDYRDHWATELLEEYTYFTQAQFERALTERGLRIVVSAPLWNPWIVANRFVGKIALRSTDGAPLPFPPTNYLIVGEKVPRGSGVRFVERARSSVAPKFLKLTAFERVSDGRVFELAERPNRTIDVLPWFEHDGRAFVICKRDFPRPIANVTDGDLASVRGGGYLTEPVAGAGLDVRGVLRERAGIADAIEVSTPWRYFTSPGGLNERVDAYLCRVQPWLSSREMENYTSFSSSGSVRYLDATQTLRACQVGGMFDARLELAVYRLLRETKRACGPWIGAEIALLDGDVMAGDFTVPKRAAFREVPLAAPAFLDVRRARFEELDASDHVVSAAELEYVTPKALSASTITLLPALRVKGVVHVGLELRDLPAVQAFEGTSALLTLPACRLPRAVTTLDAAEAFARERLAAEFSLPIERLVSLGGRYFPSVGVTPEVVYPYVALVRSGGASLRWVTLDDAIARADELRDAHLLTSLFRLRHALNAS